MKSGGKPVRQSNHQAKRSLSDFDELHFRQAHTALSPVSAPPRLVGTMWSIARDRVSPQYTHSCGSLIRIRWSRINERGDIVPLVRPEYKRARIIKCFLEYFASRSWTA